MLTLIGFNNLARYPVFGTCQVVSVLNQRSALAHFASVATQCQMARWLRLLTCVSVLSEAFVYTPSALSHIRFPKRKVFCIVRAPDRQQIFACVSRHVTARIITEVEGYVSTPSILLRNAKRNFILQELIITTFPCQCCHLSRYVFFTFMLCLLCFYLFLSFRFASAKTRSCIFI